MSKWIAEFDLEDGDTMPEHMDLEYKGAKLDFHCRPLEQEPTTKNEAKYCDRNICLKNEYNNVGCEDCEVTKSQEPTTRNCFGCKYSKDNHNADTEECHLCMWKNQYTPTTKNDLAHNLCNSCTNIGCEFQSGIVRTKCAFYMPPHIEPDNCGNYVNKEPTTKNDLGVDAISKQAVLNKILKFSVTDGRNVSVTSLWTEVNDLPPITPQEPRWIPISERSPKACEYIDGVARHYLVQNEYGDMLVARYDGEGWEQMYQYEYFEDDVIAWMPLPKPYEPQESEDKE